MPVSDTTVEVLTDVERWNAIETHWRELCANAVTAAPTVQWDWLTQWWRIYGNEYGAGGLRILLLWKAGRLVGALPLYVNNRNSLKRIMLLSTGEDEAEETCAEYLDLLAEPSVTAEDVDQLARPLIDMGRSLWDCIHLGPLSNQSRLMTWSEKFISAGFSVNTSDHGEGRIADLSGGFEAYLSRLSGNSRSQARRLLRDAEEAGVEFSVTCDSTDGDIYFNQLIELHQAQWQARGKSGCFDSQRFTLFHRSLIHRWIPTHRAILARLSHQGQPVALILGYAAQGKFDYYLSGARTGEKLAVKSPGITAHLLLMRHLIERNITRYDFLGGTSRYKLQYSTEGHGFTSLQIDRPTLRTSLASIRKLFTRAIGKCAGNRNGPIPVKT